MSVRMCALFTLFVYQNSPFEKKIPMHKVPGYTCSRTPRSVRTYCWGTYKFIVVVVIVPLKCFNTHCLRDISTGNVPRIYFAIEFLIRNSEY